MNISKPYSPACERNREPILAVMQEVFQDTTHVLEIGSGTGQHAVYFGHAMPWLIWQPSDLSVHHQSISAWLEDTELTNVKPPLTLDVNQPNWPITEAGSVFSANTVHIIAWEAVGNLFDGVGKILENDDFFLLYGPFNYQGNYTSQSNAEFDIWLKQRDPLSGIRDFEAICDLAKQNSLQLKSDFRMPANNRLLVFKMKI